MSRRSLKSTRGFSTRKKPLRTLTEPDYDTEKLVSSSMGHPESVDADASRSHRHTHPDLPLGSQPIPHHDYSAHEITNVPAPIPDTGLPPPSVGSTTLITSPPSASQTTDALTRSHVASKSTFVPLPYLKTDNLTEIEEEAALPSSVIRPSSTVRPIAATTPVSDSYHRNSQPNASRLSTAGIIALAVSGSLIFLIAIVLAKVVKRPHRRRTPTPSLPILHDGTFPHDKPESEGSPIFGGKECSSPTLQARSEKGDAGLWTWTQYNSGIPKPAPTVTVTRSSSQGQPVNGTRTNQEDGLGEDESDAACAQGQNRGQYPFAEYGSSNAVSKSKNPIALRPVQNAITRAVSRLSTVSMSLYPNSPGGYSQVGADVGLALDGVTHEGAPGNAVGGKYKDRLMMSRDRASMLALASIQDTAALRRSHSFAYGGMEPTSPPIVSPSRVQLNGGRARIKSTHYTPGSYPRASAAAATNHGKDDGINQGQNKVQRVDSRRGRELTSALGLSSLVPPSPQPTLYPDDSMSVIGEAKKIAVAGRSQKKPVPKTSCDSPTTDTAASLGSLMMVDFAGSKSTASLVNVRACEVGRTEEGGSHKKMVEDKPPRVPSPPPIPSLAQMALQHGDPDGYGEYHSPTYSIYGLYDGDRKSRGY